MRTWLASAAALAAAYRTRGATQRAALNALNNNAAAQRRVEEAHSESRGARGASAGDKVRAASIYGGALPSRGERITLVSDDDAVDDVVGWFRANQPARSRWLGRLPAPYPIARSVLVILALPAESPLAFRLPNRRFECVAAIVYARRGYVTRAPN